MQTVKLFGCPECGPPCLIAAQPLMPQGNEEEAEHISVAVLSVVKAVDSVGKLAAVIQALLAGVCGYAEYSSITELYLT